MVRQRSSLSTSTCPGALTFGETFSSAINLSISSFVDRTNSCVDFVRLRPKRNAIFQAIPLGTPAQRPARLDWHARRLQAVTCKVRSSRSGCPVECAYRAWKCSNIIGVASSGSTKRSLVDCTCMKWYCTLRSLFWCTNSPDPISLRGNRCGPSQIRS